MAELQPEFILDKNREQPLPCGQGSTDLFRMSQVA